MKKSKKPNPKKIPRSQVDVDKAEKRGQLFGMEFMLYLVLFILKDRHNAPYEDLCELGKETNEYSDQISAGEIKLRDVKLALKEEYGITIKL